MNEWAFGTIAAGIAVGGFFIGLFQFLRTSSAGYEKQLREQLADTKEQFKLCHEERQSLERQIRHKDQQLLELMLDHLEGHQ